MRLLVSLCASALLLAFAVPAALAEDSSKPEPVESEVITLVTGEYAPFTGSDLEHKGLASEIVARVLKELGKDVELVFKPWKRAYDEARDGKYIGTFPYSRAPERVKDFYFSVPLYTFSQYFYSNADTPFEFTRYEDMDGSTICIPLGYTIHPMVDLEKEGRIKILRPADMPGCMRMVKLGRADAARAIDHVGWATIEGEFGSRDGFHMDETPARTVIQYMMVNKVDDVGLDFLADFDSALLMLQRAGEIQPMLDRHLR